MYRVRVLVNERPIPVYNDKEGQKWVEAREEAKFSIKVENNHHKRILAVISVDGLNVINAEHEDPMFSPGYIIDANNSLSIPGWKVGKKKAREFIFTGKENSYVSKIGADQNNAGIIGVAIISEAPNFWYSVGYNPHFPEPTRWIDPYFSSTPNSNPLDYTIYSSTSYTTSSSSDISYEKKELAVGSGVKKDFLTEGVYFSRDKIETILTIRYDTKENLLEKGIMVKNGPMPFLISNIYCPDV